MTTDPYADFADRYQGPGDPMRDEARVTFFRTLFEKRGVRTALDCACGTGEDLIRVHSLGVSVQGSDVSRAMLDQARKRLAEYGLSIPLRQGDFRNLSGSFDAVLCMTTSLPHLLDETDILQALRSMRNALNSNGILILTQGLTDKQYNDRLRFAPVINTPESSRIMVMDYFETEWEVHVLDLVHTRDKQNFKRASFRYKLLLRDDYDRLLADAGFTQRHFYGDWDFTPYDKSSSRRLIVVATR
jgi:ubiquinone/menaquinone biosynthesis C-methylase UbiE